MKDLKEMKKLLIVVDMINGFVKEGNMADSYISHIIDANIKLVQECLDEKEGVAFIKDSHDNDCREFKRYPIHCVAGTSEAELVDELKPYENRGMVYTKNSTSTIFAPNFINDIEQMKKLREVIITGCCTDICVANLALPLQNYFDEFDRDVNIIIPTDAVETYNAPIHNREEYNELAYKLFNQAGIQLVKTYKGGNRYGK